MPYDFKDEHDAVINALLQTNPTSYADMANTAILLEKLYSRVYADTCRNANGCNNHRIQSTIEGLYRQKDFAKALYLGCKAASLDGRTGDFSTQETTRQSAHSVVTAGRVLGAFIEAGVELSYQTLCKDESSPSSAPMAGSPPWNFHLLEDAKHKKLPDHLRQFLDGMANAYIASPQTSLQVIESDVGYMAPAVRTTFSDILTGRKYGILPSHSHG